MAIFIPFVGAAIMFVLVYSAVLLLFLALNLGAASAAMLGLTMTVVLRWRHNHGVWPWLFAMPLLLGGIGALSSSWGASYYARLQWPQEDWFAQSWTAGYIVGGAIGVLVGFGGVLCCKWDDVRKFARSCQDTFTVAKAGIAEFFPQ
ncbi:hypothetical protein EON80_13510 [bacterium]|nr:MAG: hypothetical protein EON80_13510 [bacterium]